MDKKYKVLQLTYLDLPPNWRRGVLVKNRLYLRSTDEGVMTSLFEEISKIIPTARMNITRKTLESDRTLSIEIFELKDQDLEAAWLVFDRLCTSGWNPFQVIFEGSEGYKTYYFKKEAG